MKSTTWSKCYTVDLRELTDSVNIIRSHCHKQADKQEREHECIGWLYQTAHHEMPNLESLPLALANFQRLCPSHSYRLGDTFIKRRLVSLLYLDARVPSVKSKGESSLNTCNQHQNVWLHLHRAVFNVLLKLVFCKKCPEQRICSILSLFEIILVLCWALRSLGCLSSITGV